MKSINGLYMLGLLASLSIAAPAASTNSIARSKQSSDDYSSAPEPLQWIKRDEDQKAEPLQWIKRDEDQKAEPLQWI
ncbi:hypothetical protein N7519_006027 [Penicillium mononematosum]|uniref:uncharacterized protein n=1 Tax=Penicillium mononematosum TaxID=268346 RepID=UPI002548CA5F|nr:uncharacterized protein N7519_006027 [Penicillium mononematosum]KAJ6184726.1 hypothetical protein N7519_006027 [Penicillium mononematosum]